MFELPLNRSKWPRSLENMTEVKVFASSLWMLAAHDRFTPSHFWNWRTASAPVGELGKLGEMINSGGHGKSRRAGLKTKVRQGQKNPLWRKKKSDRMARSRLAMSLSFHPTPWPPQIISVRVEVSNTVFHMPTATFSCWGRWESKMR